ncbi:MAG: hypothetical protein PUF12_01895 [Thermoflexaceae bacterium]|nr:hypothetical protein [Thermoflexaceae bacterium]
MTYEELQIMYNNINIVEMDLSGVNGLKGLYVDKNIAIEKRLNQKEKSCILAEEIGHFYTSSGNIIDQTDVSNRKQEYRARLKGYEIKIGLSGIIECYKRGCRSIHDMAEFLDATEDYIQNALNCYKNKYGICTQYYGYLIIFEPSLAVMKMVES